MIMKRYLLLPIMALLLTSCLSPYGELVGIANVPGVEPGKGNNYDDRTTYKGALLPDPSYGEDRQGMIDLLMLVGEQRGDVDDALFVQRLDEKIFNCTKRFMYITDADSSTPDWWTDAMMWDGGEMHYDIALYDDGTLAVRYELGAVGDFDMIDYIVENYGYHGWSESMAWEYDPETNTLYTSEDRSSSSKPTTSNPQYTNRPINSTLCTDAYSLTTNDHTSPTAIRAFISHNDLFIKYIYSF